MEEAFEVITSGRTCQHEEGIEKRCAHGARSYALSQSMKGKGSKSNEKKKKSALMTEVDQGSGNHEKYKRETTEKRPFLPSRIRKNKALHHC